MGRTDRTLRKFVAVLLEYAESSKVFNPAFTSQQIPEMFSGWTEVEFNKVHHGAGSGCCTCIGPERYQVNVDHCNMLQAKFNDSRRSTWRLRVAIIGIIVGIILWCLNYIRNYEEKHNDNDENTKINITH